VTWRRRPGGGEGRRQDKWLKPQTILKCEQFPEERAYAHAGIVIAASADGVRFLFIISINWTIQSTLHEAREGNWTRIPYLCANFINERIQKPRMVRI
jgi:hypothetical protein